ncbi:MAG: LTA synthase family protein [Campylobacteraceae bacterium]|nr:LTA synthase family protein [Campylobacteraceae bacterium]
MRAFERFFYNLQQDFKAFFYFLILLCVFRAIFIYMYAYQLDDMSEIWLSMWYGLRLSLKSAAWIALIGFVFSALPHIIWAKYPKEIVRKIWYATLLAILTILFFIKIPYYGIFNSGFDIMLINGAHDDFSAIMDTAVKEYGLFWKLPLALITTALLIFIFFKILHLKTFSLHINNKKTFIAYSVVTFVFLAVFAVFVRYGGAFNYANSITWENAARLKSNLLNEAILDDIQALYRVRSIYKRSKSKINNRITVEDLQKQIAVLGGQPYADTIDNAFLREVEVQRLPKKPTNVIFILGETYALWPFLEEYQNLSLAQEGLKLQNSQNSLATNIMLARGTGTISAVNGLLSGLTDVGVYENYEAETFRAPYGTGIAHVMKNLGYKTVFWYGGFEKWQNIKTFALSQDFDEFYSASEFKYEGSNSWGTPDKTLFEYVTNYMAKHDKEMTFHFILTTSNHPPYTIDVVKEGFDISHVKSSLLPQISKDDKTINALGHIWYADQAIGIFVKNALSVASDTLFAITGDHAERFSFAKEVDIETLSAVPAIFYGQGVKKEWFGKNIVGSHTQMIPTLVELIGEKGYKYSSILPSLFDGTDNEAFNHNLWVKDGKMGKLDSNNKIDETLKLKIVAARTIALWRIKNGNRIHQ